MCTCRILRGASVASTASVMSPLALATLAAAPSAITSPITYTRHLTWIFNMGLLSDQNQASHHRVAARRQPHEVDAGGKRPAARIAAGPGHVMEPRAPPASGQARHVAPVDRRDAQV